MLTPTWHKIMTARTFLSLLIAALAMVMAPGAAAQAPGPGLNVAAELVAESRSVRPGDTVALAFVMKPKPTWHGYWENPGDAGIGMSFDWTLPDGVTAGAPRYQVPDTLLIAGIMNYIYKGDYAVLVDLTVGDGVAPGRLPVSVASEWLACTNEVCVPEGDTLSIVLNVVGSDTKAARDAAFADYRGALPRPLGSEATYQVTGDIFRLSIPLPAAMPVDEAYFFAREDGVVDYGAPQRVTRDGDRVMIETRARGGGDEPLTGVLRLGRHDGLELTATPGEVAISGTAIGGAQPAGDGGGDALLLIGALGGAVLGGLLLNLMPCVFPILSLKAIGIARAGGDEATVRREALAYTAGVVLVAAGLGALLLALRSSGAAVGWAFQLQDPRVIFVLLALVAAIALNLAGLFELPSISVGNQLATSGGASGSFWTGALAAFVATPCTGPFMAAALGATIVLPPAAALVIFAGLGVGLALPFLLIAYVPALRTRLPRPGPWLETFRKVMAVPMFVTAIGLVWLLGRQVGTDALALALLVVLGLALALWWLGSAQRGGAARGPALGGALAAAMVAGVVVVPAAATDPQPVASASALPAEPFSDARLAELRAGDRPVFAYFTADWCLTCKANEAAAVERAETAQAFAQANVAVLVGDWTTPDPEISAFLESHGRAGVPLYLYYAPGQEPVILPQILTVSTLTDLVA